MGLPKADPFPRLLRANAGTQALAHAVSLSHDKTTGHGRHPATPYQQFHAIPKILSRAAARGEFCKSCPKVLQRSRVTWPRIRL